MILVRNTFQVKFGQMKDALAVMKESMAQAEAAGQPRGRLMTDLSGPFYTLILDIEFENMAAAEQAGRDVMKQAAWQETYRKFTAHVESGRRDIYTIVA